MSGATVRCLHHVDIVVNDLDRAARRYAVVLGLVPGPRETLPERRVDLIRFRVGATWLILVQPTGDGPVRDFLEANGEGFYHMAFEVADVAAAAAALQEQGVVVDNPRPRRGLDGWKLVDIDTWETAGAMVQLAEVGEA